MAAIFNNSRWLPDMRSNMTANSPHHLYKILKFSELSEFSDVRNSPLPHVNYRVREPHMSHMGINVYAYCPLHLPKKVTEKPSVNHIGSSTSHQWLSQTCSKEKSTFQRHAGFLEKVGHKIIKRFGVALLACQHRFALFFACACLYPSFHSCK